MGDDLPTSILTKGQREYLSGQKTPSQERTMKTRIRDRLRTAIRIDGILLEDAVGDGRIDPKRVVDGISLDELSFTLTSCIKLVYRLAQAGGLDGEKAIQQGLREAKETRAEALLAEFRDDPSSMTFSELSLLKQTGEITAHELVEAFETPAQEETQGITSRRELDELASALKEAGYDSVTHDESGTDEAGDTEGDIETLRERFERDDSDLMRSEIAALFGAAEIDVADMFEYYETVRDREGSLPDQVLQHDEAETATTEAEPPTDDTKDN